MRRQLFMAALGAGCLSVWFPFAAPPARAAITITPATTPPATTPPASTLDATTPARTPGASTASTAPSTPTAPGTAAPPATTAAAPGAIPGAPDALAAGGWVPDGKGRGMYVPNAPKVKLLDLGTSGNGIFYHGGAVILGTTHVYFIWYGNWSSNTATTILPDWASNVGGSAYYAINATYYDGANNHVANSVTYGGAVFDNYSLGTSIDDNAIFTIVSTAIANGSLPADANGVYFVLTSPDVAETSGFCTSFCGWHSWGTFNGVLSQYSFVGNTLACPGGCEGSPGNEPNGNEGADGMASIMTHELDESVTDPHGDAWYDAGGNEVGDLCNFQFGGKLYRTANGSIANLHLGSRYFLLQEDWVNAGGGSCSIGLSQNTRFYTLTPCRLVDTRLPNGPLSGPILQAGQTRTFALAGGCGVPATAKALAVNVTETQSASAGFLTLHAADQQAGGTSTINYAPGNTLANNAYVRLSGEGSGSISVLNSSPGAVHFILDVTGYFQ
jgi:hypothetical protein